MRDQYGFEIGTLEAYSGEAELEQLWEEINEAFYEAERGVRAPGRGRGGVRRRGVVGTTSIIFPPEVIISLPPAGGKSTLSGFAKNSAQLTDDHRRTISAIARIVIDRNGTPNQPNRIQVVGHTDSSGNTEFNLDLGHKRARAVRLALQRIIEAGAIPIKATGKSFQMPAFEECSAGAGRPVSTDPAANRRVEVILSR
jgi:outer membrane protein OmpA-like peptidoglycan-associated protein